MASQFLRFVNRPLLLSMPLAASFLLFCPKPAVVIHCDYAPRTPGQPAWCSRPSPLEGDCSFGSLNPHTVRQISLGSVLGLVAGVGLRIFSRTLTFTLGVAILLIEWAASKGYNIVPPKFLQRYVKSVDVRRAVTKNLAFKASFGTTLMLSAFSEF
ncbi:hypothetical protein D8B26_006542 [Coccidioides posadasii str. Silveira]|uniref:Uncharacterized protein n=3 Tax=Coccidioides posadasii TaxID=199306 RepID=E9CTQ6_COCPS|nr:hypothetical protein CPC735_027360 [Coccidioides posadasii C735 delta SOWgp]EER27400.1 hypothetical protein CPC735_027360 [Coccidioides posadasii C735 delta SOWgp]EFW22996.1 conserved hypothetical protein [Coccidioides posadasii str. Silveira]KMM67213.1 hypothetical protein CPAG_03548 [Coccidioides posadasii RMSCC 3488]QVM11903.1 hypothetical protein D8B26_006542 [Coccidioides posadasii str. Silveira]|eukprot:XP_003069545.1 hypothetical protein CPC735_027360 [Coccidioides posadasii C735 delta SOWgp]